MSSFGFMLDSRVLAIWVLAISDLFQDTLLKIHVSTILTKNVLLKCQ